MTHLVVLFLDFDGVLHSAVGAASSASTKARPDETQFAHLPRLELLLQEPRYADVQICISSSWKDVYPWEEILELFSEAVRERIVDRTPYLGRIHGFWRFAEIDAWLRAHPAVKRWVAVDDAADAFPLGLEEPGHVVFTNALLGLGDDEAIERLRDALDRQLGRL